MVAGGFLVAGLAAQAPAKLAGGASGLPEAAPRRPTTPISLPNFEAMTPVTVDGHGIPHLSSRPAFDAAALPQRHPMAYVYPPGYYTRLKIHKIASFATLPLFAAEMALGNSLINNPQQHTAKAAHGLVGAGIVGLFGVNTVTGVWNMWDARHDPNGRALRLAHGILMLISDAGFAATVMNTPHLHRGVVPANYHSQALLHRNLAYFSIGVGTIGYALMLFWHH